MTRVFASLAELTELVGSTLGTSDWLTVEQERIDAFADATGDHQWIHTDPERAKDGPFGGTVAHGYLTLSLLPSLISGVYRVDGVAAAINYGLDRVRFPAPLPAGSRVRASVELLDVESHPTGTRVRTRVTVECDGVSRPVVVADTITLFAS